MTITKKLEGSKLELAIEGRLDTTTAPELEKEITESIADVKVLTLDLKDLAYISSAGLRVLLSTQKRMNKQGSMELCNVSDAIMEIFEVTGFSDILTIR